MNYHSGASLGGRLKTTANANSDTADGLRIYYRPKPTTKLPVIPSNGYRIDNANGND